MGYDGEKVGSTSTDRGVRFEPQGVGGYDENWYPVCLSDDVSAEQVIGCEFLNGRVVVFRNADGKASVLSAYCRHLGVDLRLGKIVDDTVQCPYHHWRYDTFGQCVATAVGDEPPRNAKLFKFPSAEQYGVIWAYNGEEPAYAPPHMNAPEDEVDFIAERGAPVPMDPFMLYSNTMDLQHLRSLHGIKFERIPTDFDIQPRSISYEQEMIMPGLGASAQKVRLQGTNCIALENEIMGRMTFMMSAGLAIRGPMTHVFNISATPKGTGKPGEEQMIKQHLRMVSQFGRQLNEEDGPVMQVISPRLDQLSASDRALKIFFEYARNYPRSNVASDLISNDYLEGAPRRHPNADLEPQVTSEGLHGAPKAPSPA